MLSFCLPVEMIMRREGSEEQLGVWEEGRGLEEAAGRREDDLGVSSFLTSIRAASLGSLVARGAGLINNEFTPHAAPPASSKVTLPSSQPPPDSKLNNPSSAATTLTQSPWKITGG